MALSLLTQTPTAHPFSSLSLLSGTDHLHLHLRRLSLHRLPCPPIRMGGGPRTFPGGVSKWQWKRMQDKKAKQLLKARLLRERQIYEMRKRTELRAAVSELERPWEEVAQRAPNLFSVCADEQLKTLADRFQRPGGFDMWSERDGPQVFRSLPDIPSDRFFPKGAVHSVKPYGAVTNHHTAGEDLTFDDWIARGGGNTRRRRTRRSLSGGGAVVDVEANDPSDDSNEEDRRESHRTDSPRLGVRGSTERRGGGVVGRGGDGRGGRRMNAGRGSLRPSADLYAGDDGYRTGGYKEKFVEGSHVGSDHNGNVEAHRGRGKRGGGRGSRRTDIERVSPHPTSELYAEDGGYRMGDSTGGRVGVRGRIDRRERFEQGGRFGSDMGGITHAEEQRGKIVGRNSGVRGYSRSNAGRNSGGRGNGRMNTGRVSLRPSADLYADDGGFNGMRESSGVRSSARGSTMRRQISEEGSRFESYAATIGNGQGQHGKNVERDLDGRGDHRLKAGRVSLPPTANFYAEDGRNMRRDSKWGSGNGSRRTRARS